MDTLRNFLAHWCLESLCDFQEWVNLICRNISNSDIMAEVDALCALILSALQKLLLPASVSRLVYSNEVIQLFNRFAYARCAYYPEDFSAKLLVQSTESALGKDFNLDLFLILKSKSYEWKLCLILPLY